MSITIAESAGFCFGVNRAVKTVTKLLSEGNKVCTLGPIIHNPQIIKEFENQGVKIVSSPKDVPPGYVLVIRSHGTSPSVIEAIKQCGVRYSDATCPFVSKIHSIVAEYSRKGYNILVAGDKEHPEVVGILGCAIGDVLCFKTYEELQKLLDSRSNFFSKPFCLVSQTTFNVGEWKKSLKLLKKLYTNSQIFDTICSATAKRQSEAMNIAKKSDFMVAIGGKQSSNTAKLFDVCSTYCDTVLIEVAQELPYDKIKNANAIGITAGASTPSDIIMEVKEIMSDVIENKDAIEVSEDGQSFEQMLEESLKDFNMDERVHGVVLDITPTEVYVDVGRKQAGFIPASELSYDDVNPADVLKIGDEVDLLIMKTNDQEGTIMLSKKRLDSMKAWDVFFDAMNNETVLTGTVKDVVKGGVIVISSGLKVFIPASLATLSRKDPLNELVGKEVKFRVIEINRRRRRCVGSIRSVLNDERKELAKAFWENAEVGKVYHGVVKSLTNYGAFVDLGGVDGMIHVSELSWVRIKHPSDVVNVGDTVEVYIKDLDQEKGKISLGFKKAEDNPWVKLEKEFPVDSIVPVKIVSMTTFGAFANILPGIDGLIHISQIDNKRVEKPQDVLKIGQEVQVKITAVDLENKRVSLSIKALLDEDEPKDTTEEAVQANADEDTADTEKSE